jgi:hypothetical protein
LLSLAHPAEQLGADEGGQEPDNDDNDQKLDQGKTRAPQFQVPLRSSRYQVPGSGLGSKLSNLELGTRNSERPTWNLELGTRNVQLGTRNSERPSRL